MRVLIGIAFLLSACQPKGPESIAFGQDQCHYCRMTIANPQYGAEQVTEKGRVYKFDAAECLVNYLAENPDADGSSLYAVAFDDPKNLYPMEDLSFAIAEEYRSPMGAHLAAFSQSPPEETIFLTWEQVVLRLSE